VTLEGQVEKKTMIPLAVGLTQSVDGVVSVVDRLTFATDNTHLPKAADLTNY
jgi:osmotically-inducible protein OsmY